MAGLDLNQVTQEYFARIHRAALVLTGNPWDADDLAQETFLVVAGQLEKFEGRSRLYTWLYGILLNLERRQRRRRGTWRRKFQVLSEQHGPDQQLVPPSAAAVEVAEWKSGLWARVAQLPDGQRQCLVLRFSEGLQQDEIAEALQCPVGTVKSRIYYGLIALRQMMESDDEAAKQPPEFPNEDIHRAI